MGDEGMREAEEQGSGGAEEQGSGGAELSQEILIP
jgi:hypothetical protein